MAKASDALNKVDLIWKSETTSVGCSFDTLQNVEYLMYEANAWTLTKTFQSKLDGTYTESST